MNHRFTDKMFRQILLPTVLSAVGLSIANIADSLVVGISIGEEGLAAIAIALPVFMLYSVFYVGVGIGGSVEYSRLIGAGKNEKALEVFNQMMAVSVAVGVVFTLIGLFFTDGVLFVLGTPSDSEIYAYTYDYTRVLLCCAPVLFVSMPLQYFVRSDDNPRLASVGFICGNLVDLSLNVLLVLVLRIGVTGAIWSTVIGQMVTIGFYLPHLISKKHLLRLSATKLKFKTILSTYKIGFASSNQFISQFLFIMLANRILVARSGDGSGIAIFDVVMNASYLGMTFFQAASDTIQPLASTFHGEKNPTAQRRVLSRAMIFGMITGVATLVALCIFAPELCRLFGLNDRNIPSGADAVRIYCLGAAFAGFSVILSGYFQSVGRDNYTLFISLLRGTVLLLIFTVLFGLAFSGRCFWWLFPATEILSIAVYLIFRKAKLFSGRDTPVDGRKVMSLMIDTKDYNLQSAVEKIEGFCEQFDASMKQIHYVTMTAEELCTAIIDNAFVGSDSKNRYIQITVICEEQGGFRLCIRDNSMEFNPFGIQTRKASLDDDDALGGLGIMMVKSKAKDFYYRRYQNFNILIVRV